MIEEKEEVGPGMPANDPGDSDAGDFSDDGALRSPEERLATVEAELADTKDRLLRALAETENVRRRFQRKEIVESVIYPSKVIADQYRSLTVVTSAGLVHTGMPLKQDNPDKLVMVLNDATPNIEVDAETYEVRADGELLTCEPAKSLPMTQRYFLF